MTAFRPALADPTFTARLIANVEREIDETAAIEQLGQSDDPRVLLLIQRVKRLEQDMLTITSKEIVGLAGALASMTIRPCHVTGMHDPNHTDKYLCQEQKSDLIGRVISAAGIALGDIPHELHPEGSCYYCHNVPNSERERERQRALYGWAGVEVTGELAEPGTDIPREGDEELLYAVLTEKYQTWQALLPQLPFSSTGRFWAVANKLFDAGRAQISDITVRRTPITERKEG